MEKYLELGKIINTHGIKGEVKIECWTDSPEFLKQFKHLYIDGVSHKLVSGRPHKGFLIAQLEGVEDVNSAMALKNKLVQGDRAEVKLPKGHFFLQDIMGASVRDESGAELGKLTDILELPQGNVYVVTGEREILIPAREEFVLSTDPGAKVITVRLLEGM